MSKAPFSLRYGTVDGWKVLLEGDKTFRCSDAELTSYVQFCRAAALAGIAFSYAPAERPGSAGRNAWLAAVAVAAAAANKIRRQEYEDYKAAHHHLVGPKPALSAPKAAPKETGSNAK